MKCSVSLWSADLLALGDSRIANEVTLSGSSAEIFVDGGIRRQTIPMLAKTAADGVIPGSLVFGEKDPIAAVRWIKSHNPKKGRAAA
jgi:pentose-5-phosphate-3-epimerase